MKLDPENNSSYASLTPLDKPWFLMFINYLIKYMSEEPCPKT